MDRRGRRKEEGGRRVEGGDSPELTTDFTEAVLVASRVETDMCVLFGSKDSVPDDHFVFDLPVWHHKDKSAQILSLCLFSLCLSWHHEICSIEEGGGITYVLSRVISSAQTDKDLLCIPVEQR